MELDPNHADANADKGAALCLSGKYDDAILFFDRVLRFHDVSVKTRVRTLRNKAISLRELGDPENAKKCDEEADRLDLK